MGKTKLDVSRYTPLAKEGAMSQQELDNAIQADRGNEAAVAAARAAVRQAELNLEWTQVRSPIDGIAGISVAQIGDLISASTLFTTVSRVDPLKVTFPISEREYLKFADLIGRAMQAEKRAEKHGPPLELILADGSVYSERGAIALPDREVDLKTGTITLVSYFSESEPYLAPRFVREGAGGDGHEEGGALSAAARRAGTARGLPPCRGDCGEHSVDASGENGGAGWEAVGG